MSTHIAWLGGSYKTEIEPVWDVLICIFNSYNVRAILSWGVVNCVGAITIVLHTNWLHCAWK